MTGPDPSAAELAGLMLDDDETMRTIIQETVDSAANGQIRESGRTICNGSQVHGPESRHPTSVSLYVCPYDRGGSWHSHVTPDQLRSPYNSLPDIANVLYENLDVIVVAGTEKAEAVVRPADIEATRDEFLDVVGAPEARSPKELTDAIYTGRTASPEEAGQRFREARPDLFTVSETGYGDLADAVDEHVTETGFLSQPYDVSEAMAHSAFYERKVFSGGMFGEIEREVEEPIGRLLKAGNEKVPMNVKSVLLSNALGVMAGGLVNRVFWGE